MWPFMTYHFMQQPLRLSTSLTRYAVGKMKKTTFAKINKNKSSIKLQKQDRLGSSRVTFREQVQHSRTLAEPKHV